MADVLGPLSESRIGRKEREKNKIVETREDDDDKERATTYLPGRRRRAPCATDS